MPPSIPDTEVHASPSRKSATIARLLKEARQAFSANGLAGARVDDIARAAGVTKQLVYHYFTSKEDLFASVLEASAQDVLTDLLALEIDHLPPVDALRVFLEYAFDQYLSNPTLGQLAQEGLRFHEQNALQSNCFRDLAPALVSQVERILQRGAQSGDFRSDIDARLFYAASAILTTCAFTNRYTVSTVASVDSTSPGGVSVWREFSVNFVLSAVLSGERPSLHRPATRDAI